MAKTAKTREVRGESRGEEGREKAAAGRRPAPRQKAARALEGAARQEAARRQARARRGRLVAARGRSEGKYVYCIIRSDQPAAASARSASAPSRPRCTRSTTATSAPSSRTRRMVVQDPTRENVLAHQRVNETVMQKHTVIPMSFGTVFKTDDDIMELLRSAYDAFSDVLNKMQDKFEFGLKVLWDRDQIIREIEEEDEDIRRLKSEISSQKGSTYFARMQYGRLIDASLQSQHRALRRRDLHLAARASPSPRAPTSRSATR